MMEACLRTFWGIAIENRENDHKDHAKDHKTRQRKITNMAQRQNTAITTRNHLGKKPLNGSWLRRLLYTNKGKKKKLIHRNEIS